MNFGPHSVSCRCAGCPKSSAGNNDTRARSWTCAIQIACRCPMVWKAIRSEEHTSELQSLMRITYAVFCLKKTTHLKYSDLTYVNIYTYNLYFHLLSHYITISMTIILIATIY